MRREKPALKRGAPGPHPVITASVLALAYAAVCVVGWLALGLDGIGAPWGLPTTLFFIPLALVYLAFATGVPVYHALRTEFARRDLAGEYALLIEHSADGIVTTARDGRILSANPAACRILGYPEETLVSNGPGLVVDETDPAITDLLERRRRHRSVRARVPARRADGAKITLALTSALYRNSAGAPRNVMVIRDITETIIAEQEREKAQLALNSITNAVAILDSDWRVMAVNNAFEEISGRSAEAVTGRLVPFRELLDGHPRERQAMDDRLAQYGVWHGSVSSRTSDGSPLRLAGTITRVGEDGPDCSYICCFYDCAEIEAYKHRINVLTTFDSVTGLPNREGFTATLQRRLGALDPEKDICAVLAVNLRHFRPINESYGHAFGDAVLKAIGERLQTVVDDEGEVARHTGDSFLVCLDQISHPMDAALTAQAINDAVARPLTLQGTTITLGSGVGIGTYPSCGLTDSELLRSAEAAASEAKRLDTQGYCFYTDELGDRARQFIEIAAQLRLAMETAELTNYYQPVVRSRDFAVVGFEALVRWRHPDRVVPPGDFLPVAEEAGLMRELSNVVVENVCLDWRRWFRSRGTELSISINFSGEQFGAPDMADRLLERLESFNIDPQNVVAEITEDTLVSNQGTVVPCIHRLRAAGVRVLIDDFGTGYSSLSYLAELEIDGLKIDRTFIARMHDNEASEAIVRGIIALAGELDLIVVAEGVETHEQALYLRELGCRYLQGYYFHRPAPAPRIHARYLDGDSTSPHEGDDDEG
ncbi:hypothetical protein KBTX_01188 [wastewater metagenome]|uniref:Uncharacterized protein n=2 Tax=unclassified sequences TaxID=12908 RepID=A0A5B8R8M2_9ZZZZ|nr:MULTISPECIES: EAL domain-containing protein [Arhodomonas]MCS4503854.1 EAL domain-containing protein [Arhodomonas aquaeolei]QEA04871.1 hypothetical protein KBTEX_01188 [uncultured organism]